MRRSQLASRVVNYSCVVIFKAESLKNCATTTFANYKKRGKQTLNYTFAFFIMSHSNDPLHGKTLEMILTELVARYGWQKLGEIIRINCFNNNPGIKSSLTFLRKTSWARKKVEELYLNTFT